MGFRNLEKSKVFSLEEMIEYRTHRIISHSMCNSSELKLVLFSLDANEAITEEQTPNIEIFTLIEGEMMLGVQGRTMRMLSGESVVIQPQDEHYIHALTECKFLQTSLKPASDSRPQEDFMNRMIKHLPIAEVFQMEKEIEYEQNKVSSITLAQQPNLIVTLFSLYEGEEIGGHSSKGDAMVNVLDGCAQITIGERTYTVQKGESIIMPANITHALKAITSFKMLLTVVKP